MHAESKWACFVAAVLAACVVGLSGSPVFAVVFNNEDSSSDFNSATAWENDTLPNGDQARIGQAGVGGDAVPFENPSVVSMTGNFPGTVNGLRVGQDPGGVGTLNHSAGTMPQSDWSFIGVDGNDANPSIGHYNLTGTAAFGNSGNTNLMIGVGGGAHPTNPNQGFVTVADQASIQGNAVVVGWNDDNEGTLTQTGGTVTSDNWVNIGQETGAHGIYNISGGQLNTLELSVGQQTNASGEFNISGTADVNVLGNVPTADLALRVGREITGNGAMTITGSQASIDTTGFTVGCNDAGACEADGTLTFVSDAGGVSPINASIFVRLNDGSGTGAGNLAVDFSAPPPAGDVLLIDNQGGGAVDGIFAGLPEGALVPNSGGRSITYVGGDGNDVVLLIPEPTAWLLLVSMGGCLALLRRRFG